MKYTLTAWPLKKALYGRKGRTRWRGQNRFGRTPIDRFYMRKALREAEAAARRGEVPVGAVLVYRGEVIARAGNRVEEDCCALRHAEMLCLEEGAKQLGWRLTGATLYVTLEPCGMCAGGIINSRLTRLVFAASDPERGCCGSVCNLLTLPNLVHHVRIGAPVFSEEAAALLRRFFRARRIK